MYSKIVRDKENNVMRKNFFEPEMDIIRFGKEDVITTSFINDGSTEGNIGEGTDTDGWS